MILQDLTPAQRIIIRRICILQLDSLRRLLYDKSEMDLDIIEFLHQHEVSREEYEYQLLQNIKKFTTLNNNPDDLRVLDEYDQSKFRHILNTIEDEYKEKFPMAVSNLWARIFTIEALGKKGAILKTEQLN